MIDIFKNPLHAFHRAGAASFIVGGQYGSEAKGCAAAWIANELAKEGSTFHIVTTNAGAQAGHTSIHKGKKRVVYHLPTAPLIAQDEGLTSTIYINAGSIIDPVAFEKELNEVKFNGPVHVHPNAAVVTDECRKAELERGSSHTRIAGTRKGVGQALSRKVARSGLVARDHSFLRGFCRCIDLDRAMREGASVLVEVPQGVSLSVDSSFYPYTTSRNCTPAAAMADAGIHPSFYNKTMVVLRTFPIRVGNIVENGETLGTSGPCYPDQKEITWSDIGVEAEITTVTKRVRRVFTFSATQVYETFRLCYPDLVLLTFCNYLKHPAQLGVIEKAIHDAASQLGIRPVLFYQFGATTTDIGGNCHVQEPGRDRPEVLLRANAV